jgi:hypothetical protein
MCHKWDQTRAFGCRLGSKVRARCGKGIDRWIVRRDVFRTGDLKMSEDAYKRNMKMTSDSESYQKLCLSAHPSQIHHHFRHTHTPIIVIHSKYFVIDIILAGNGNQLVRIELIRMKNLFILKNKHSQQRIMKEVHYINILSLAKSFYDLHYYDLYQSCIIIRHLVFFKC